VTPLELTIGANEAGCGRNDFSDYRILTYTNESSYIPAMYYYQSTGGSYYYAPATTYYYKAPYYQKDLGDDMTDAFKRQFKYTADYKGGVCEANGQCGLGGYCCAAINMYAPTYSYSQRDFRCMEIETV